MPIQSGLSAPPAMESVGTVILVMGQYCLKKVQAYPGESRVAFL